MLSMLNLQDHARIGRDLKLPCEVVVANALLVTADLNPLQETIFIVEVFG